MAQNSNDHWLQEIVAAIAINFFISQSNNPAILTKIIFQKQLKHVLKNIFSVIAENLVLI